MQHQEECARRRRAADDSGIALLVSLAIVAILAVVVLDFSFSVRVNMHVAGDFRNRLVALEAAKAGVYYGIYVLRQDDPGRDNLQEDWAQQMGIVLNKTDPYELADETSLTEEEVGLGNHEDFLACREGGNVATASIVICDEERKINVNLLTSQGNRPVFKRWIETLIENLDFPDVDAYELVENITDWIDDDDSGVAEDQYYADLAEPYSCRDDRMESIYELKLVKGMTDLIFFGDTPYPIQLSGLEEEQWEEREELGYSLPETTPWDREEDLDASYGLANFLTAHSSGTVNLSTAPPEVLIAILDDEFLTETVIKARQESPLQTRELQNLIRQVSPTLYNTLVRGRAIAFQSTYFRIESTGKFHKAAVKTTAIVSRSNNRDITIHYWRVEDVRPESISEDVPWVNVM